MATVPIAVAPLTTGSVAVGVIATAGVEFVANHPFVKLSQLGASPRDTGTAAPTPAARPMMSTAAIPMIRANTLPRRRPDLRPRRRHSRQFAGVTALVALVSAGGRVVERLHRIRGRRRCIRRLRGGRGVGTGALRVGRTTWRGRGGWRADRAGRRGRRDGNRNGNGCRGLVRRLCGYGW